MKSTIKIEMDFETSSPVIEINQFNTDDVRDKLLKNLLERVHPDHSFLRLNYIGSGNIIGEPYSCAKVRLEPVPDQGIYPCEHRIGSIVTYHIESLLLGDISAGVNIGGSYECEVTAVKFVQSDSKLAISGIYTIYDLKDEKGNILRDIDPSYISSI